MIEKLKMYDCPAGQERLLIKLDEVIDAVNEQEKINKKMVEIEKNNLSLINNLEKMIRLDKK